MKKISLSFIASNNTMATRTKIITIFNQKGGTGKSFITLNLAGCLAFKGYKTLVIDLDGQADVSSRLGHYRSEINILQVFREGREIPMLGVPFSDFLFLAPGSVHIRTTDREMWCNGNAHGVLKNAIAPIADQFDFIIIDTPPDHESVMVDNALFASTHLLVPIGGHGPNDIENLDTVMDKFITSQFKPGGGDIEFLGVIRNSVDDGAMAKLIHQQTEHFFEVSQGSNSAVFKTALRFLKEFKNAQAVPIPIVFQSLSKPASKNFMEFTDELLIRLKLKSIKA